MPLRAEVGVAVRGLTKAVSRIELQRLQQVYDNNETKFWTQLPVGVALNTYKAKRAHAYYILLTTEATVVGYLLLVKAKIDLATTTIAGWTVAHSYLVPQIRSIGIMRRVYDLILSKGRMISNPVMTPQGVTMWVNRIKTDNRHRYVIFTGQGKNKQALPVTAHDVDSLKRTIWDGQTATLFVCYVPTDPKMKRILKAIAKEAEQKK